MPKRPDSLETLQLALELLKRIPKKQTITATELRLQLLEAGFEREPRTIQRLLETLSEFYDIERDDSTKPYLYRWKENAKGLSLPSLSTQESLLLTLAEQQLGNLLPAKLMKSMEGFFSQARGQLDAKKPTPPEREWLEKVRVVSTTQPLLPPKVDSDVFQFEGGVAGEDHAVGRGLARDLDGFMDVEVSGGGQLGEDGEPAGQRRAVRQPVAGR